MIKNVSLAARAALAILGIAVLTVALVVVGQLGFGSAVLWSAGVVVVLVQAAVLWFFLTRPVLGGLAAVTRGAEGLAQGDLAVELDASGADEVSRAVTALVGAQTAVSSLLTAVNRMSDEHNAGDIDAEIPVERFSGDYRTMAQGINDMVAGHIAVKKKAMAVVKAFGEGDFDAPLEQFPGKKAFINDTIEEVRRNLKSLIAELNRMSDEHNAGDIDAEIPVERFSGDYRTMAQGINDMVAGHIAVKKKAMAVVKAFGEGDFDAPLEQFPGKKAFINDTIEEVRRNLKSLIAELNQMSDEHNAGDIDAEIPVERFSGDYRTMAQGINDMVAGHIAVKKKAMAVVKAFGEGDFDAPLEQFPGKKAFINDTIEQVRRNLKSLIAELNHMSAEHEAGDIDVRIPAERFAGGLPDDGARGQRHGGRSHRGEEEGDGGGQGLR